MSPSDCLFCKIVAGEIPADVVLDEPAVLAFRDINPQAPTHVLVISKEHIKDASVISGEHAQLLVDMIGAANGIAEAAGIAHSGYRLVLNVGPDAGQSVFHIHLHVLGGRPMGWPPG
jgi:histidine triad (HIT) family protein